MFSSPPMLRLELQAARRTRMSASSPAASTSRSMRSMVTFCTSRENARDGASGKAGERGELRMREASSIDLPQDSRDELCLEDCLEAAAFPGCRGAWPEWWRCHADAAQLVFLAGPLVSALGCHESSRLRSTRGGPAMTQPSNPRPASFSPNAA